jgi:hypothetical protein
MLYPQSLTVRWKRTAGEEHVVEHGVIEGETLALRRLHAPDPARMTALLVPPALTAGR